MRRLDPEVRYLFELWVRGRCGEVCREKLMRYLVERARLFVVQRCGSDPQCIKELSRIVEEVEGCGSVEGAIEILVKLGATPI